MAKAGFVYAPQHTGDDTAMCLYCHINLHGWEAGDDPMYVLDFVSASFCFKSDVYRQEHKDRETRSGTSCPFLSFTPAKKSKAKARAKKSAALPEEEQVPSLTKSKPKSRQPSRASSRQPTRASSRQPSKASSRNSSKSATMMSEEAIEQAVGGINEKKIVNANKGIQELVEKDDRMEAAEQVVRGRNEKSEDISQSAREDVGKAMEKVGGTAAEQVERNKDNADISKGPQEEAGKAKAKDGGMAAEQVRGKREASMNRSRIFQEEVQEAKEKDEGTAAEHVVRGRKEASTDGSKSSQEAVGKPKKDGGEAALRGTKEGSVDVSKSSREVAGEAEHEDEGDQVTRQREEERIVEANNVDQEMIGNTQRVVHANPKGLQPHSEGDPTNDFDLPSSFFPPLANTPIYKLVSRTDEQKDMTVEQWIRYEIQLQLEQFRADGMRKLALFTERAEEVRRTIEVLPEMY
jgi:hypothetical protein